RAEAAVGAADSGSSSGLPGMTGAAGLTLAAIAQPAGTTHANAPQQALRARKSAANRKPARERVDEGPQDDTGDGHRPPQDGRKQRDGAEAHKDARQAAPAAGDGSTDTREAAAGDTAAAGHTTATAPAPPRKEEDGSRREERSWWITTADENEVEDTPETRRSRRQQWLYWSLVAVTYACLALALATVAPDLFRLPFAAEHMATWRNALTATGLATGLWAWLLARRMR
ncbi:MAG TPA: hypothetical protein PLD19_01135, partial [Luteimonas sp.]|nr:hypothetical protein [Luteimonas sp.]